MTQTVIHVEGMTCGHCKAAVEKAVKTLKGVSNAAVDMEAKSLAVDFDPQLTSEQVIRDAVSRAGYEAR